MTVAIFGFSLDDMLSAEEIKYKRFNFSAGEVQVRLPLLHNYQRLIIESKYPNSEDIVAIVMILNALKSMRFAGQVVVQLPYLPYSRQDRPCYSGEAFSLEAIMGVLKTGLTSQYKLVTWDVHSRVAGGQLSVGMFHNVTADVLIKRFSPSVLNADEFPIPNEEDYVVVAPDKGAVERANLVAKAIGVSCITYAIKVRDSDNGQIAGVELDNPEVLQEKTVVIADDICDGGRTFIELAKVIWEKNPAAIYLYVTHGIFSKGFDVFYENDKLLIDRIITPNLFPGVKVPSSLNCPAVFTLY